MKNLRLSLVIFLFGGFSIQSCRTACDQTINYYAKVPVYGHLEGLRSSFEIIAVQPMDTIESIVELPIGYFLLEKDKGIHVIDKAIPSAPKLTSFIKLPGILSIAGNGSTLYVGQATDLVVLNVSDLNAITKQDVHKSLFNLEFMKADSFIVSYKYELVKW
jgi:hypothetical protein